MNLIITTITIAAALIPMIEGHLSMHVKGIYPGGDGMGPLDASNFPCTRDGREPTEDGPTLTPGETTEITLMGSAVHSGGSCQISITYDQPPTQQSIWKVMKSIEGGCPIQIQGNLPPNPGYGLPPLTYQVTQGLPSGKATIAWTWFNKSGIREMYMRCHKATIQGNSNDMGVFNALPDMLVAQINTCSIIEGKSVKFPNPGSQVDVNVPDTELVDPAGDCGAAGSKVSGSKPSPVLEVTPSSHTTPQTPVESPLESSALESPVAESSKARPQLLEVAATTTAGPTTPLPPPPESVAQQPRPEGACTEGERQCGNGDWSLCDHGKWVYMGPWQTGWDCSAK